MLDRSSKRAAKLAAHRRRDTQYRQRRRQGMRIAKGVTYDSTIIDLLIASRALTERDACNDWKVVAERSRMVPSMQP
jgi:hypothetical protein